MVLSYSKYLMDRLFACLGDLGVKAAYTDTDSVVFPASAVEPVSKLFEEKFGITFMGSGLLQFHSEFEMTTLDGKEIKTHDGKSISSDLVTAKSSYYLGKKLYFHRLEAQVDGWTYSACKFSAKGFTKRGILEAGYLLLEQEGVIPEGKRFDPEHRSHLNDLSGIETLFDKASKGGEIDIDLFPAGCGAPRFVFEFGVGVSTPSTPFIRKFAVTRKELRPETKDSKTKNKKKKKPSDVESVGEYTQYLQGEPVLGCSDGSDSDSASEEETDGSDGEYSGIESDSPDSDL